MSIEFYDSFEAEPIDWLRGESNPNVTSKLVTAHEVLQLMERQLTEILEVNKPIEEILELRREIQKILEQTRPLLVPNEDVGLCAQEIHPNGTYSIDSSALQPTFGGISGSYFLSTQDGTPLFVVKPIDEDISCLNNPNGYDFQNVRNLFNMQLYRSVFREMAAASIARTIHVASIAPTTALAILQSDRFFDIADFDPQLGPSTKEKLCSCMEYVSNSTSLSETLQNLQQQGLSDEEISLLFDQSDFEDVNIFIWATGEQDGHGWNILVYTKENGLLGLKKIDNGLSLPENPSSFFRNSLIYLPNANRPLSPAGLAKIGMINTQTIGQIQQDNFLERSIPATTQRIERLKAIVAEDPDLTIKEIHQRLSQ